MMSHTMEHVLAVQQQNRGSSTSLMVSGERIIFIFTHGDDMMGVFSIVKLRERERHRVDQGKKVKKWMVDGGYPFPDALH